MGQRDRWCDLCRPFLVQRSRKRRHVSHCKQQKCGVLYKGSHLCTSISSCNVYRFKLKFWHCKRRCKRRSGERGVTDHLFRILLDSIVGGDAPFFGVKLRTAGALKVAALPVKNTGELCRLANSNECANSVPWLDQPAAAPVINLIAG